MNILVTMSLIFAILPEYALAQYGSGGGYNQNNYGPKNQIQQQAYINDNVEQKFVNSGQSVVLVCDLPNNMPDGKVS